MLRTLAVLVALVAAWAMLSHAREIDEGTATNEDPGNPVDHWDEVYSRRFTPSTNDVYFRLSNPSGHDVEIRFVGVRVAEPGDPGAVLVPGFNSGGPYTVHPASPIRTIVVDHAVTDVESQLDLGITLGPNEQLLIEGYAAVPGVEHVITLRVEFEPEIIDSGVLEIWDGECND